MLPKERILTIASKLFHFQGYNSTGINQIIEESRVAKSSFYHIFKSKEDLCVAFLERRHVNWFEKLNDYTASFTDDSEKILACFDFIKYMNESENFRGCSFINLRFEISEDNQRILAVIQAHKSSLKSFFQELTDEPELAVLSYLLLESAILESAIYRDNWPVDSAKKIILNTIKQNG